MRPSVAPMLLLVVAVVATPARAAPERGVIKEARTLFEAGTAHYNLNEFAQALDSFERAYRLKPDPVFLFNIAQCHRQLGRFERASQMYRNYLREEPRATNRSEVERLIADMERRALASLTPPLPQPLTEPARDAARPFVVTAPQSSGSKHRRDTRKLWLGAGLGIGAAVVVGVAIGIVVAFSLPSDAPPSTLGTFGVTLR